MGFQVMRACLIRNTEDSHVGSLQEVLTDLGYSVSIVLRESELNELVIEKFDLFVSMGSDWSVYSPEICDIVAIEADLIRLIRRRGVPIVGICFGAQLISHTFGGVVSPNSRSEIGWKTIESGGGSILGGNWMEWHSDGFTAPPSFSVIGSNEFGVQAIIKDHCLGVQFHPEAETKQVAQWIDSGGFLELAAVGLDPTDLLASTAKYEKEAEKRCNDLFSWFLSESLG
jgi:GMP synthase (glutamine-hydrolysing)